VAASASISGVQADRGGEDRLRALHQEPRPFAAPARDRRSEDRLAWLLAEIEALRCVSPNGAVPRRRGFSAEQFRDQHYAMNWPVLMAQEIALWPAVKHWSPDYLKRLVGDASVQVKTRGGRAEAMPFDAFIDRAANPGEVHLTAADGSPNAHALAALHGDLGFLDRYLARDAQHLHGDVWMGPPDAFMALRQALSNKLLLQVAGRQVVLMASPGETPRLYSLAHGGAVVRDVTESSLLARVPGLDGLRVHRMVLNPGDVLFVPFGWWRQMRALDFSVTVSHTNFRWVNDSCARYPAS
jgi:hypothetical protein